VTEFQGWLSLLLGLAGIIGVIYTISANFTRLKLELSHLVVEVATGFKVNHKKHEEYDGRFETLGLQVKGLETIVKRNGGKHP